MGLRILAAALCVSVSAGSAFAGGMTDWTGFYVGGNAGVAFLDGDARVSLGAVSTNIDLNDTGFTFGGQAGYNWQIDGIVFGIEGDFNYLDVDESGALAVVGATTSAFELDSDWFATLRGRVGMTMDQSLIYGTAGVAFMDSELRVSVVPAGATAKDSDVLVGFAVGGGIEHAFSQDWSMKLEYLYMNFESHSLSAGAASARVEPELHVIRAGVNWHF